MGLGPGHIVLDGEPAPLPPNFPPIFIVAKRSLGHPSKFQRVLRRGSVTARHSSSRRQPNFAALNRGRHLYSTGQPSCWRLAHILVVFEMFALCLGFVYSTVVFHGRPM